MNWCWTSTPCCSKMRKCKSLEGMDYLWLENQVFMKPTWQFAERHLNFARWGSRWLNCMLRRRDTASMPKLNIGLFVSLIFLPPLQAMWPLASRRMNCIEQNGPLYLVTMVIDFIKVKDIVIILKYLCNMT